MPLNFTKKVLRKGLRAFKSKPVPRQLPTGKEPLNIAIVGMGKMGRVHAELLSENPFYKLVAICSRHEEINLPDSVECPQQYTSFGKLLATCPIDVVLVATPHKHHKDFVIQALEAGRHVICEKPLAITTADADAILEKAESSRATLTVISQNRFEPTYRKVKAILDSGEFGSVHRCSMTETFWRTDGYYQSAQWRGTWQQEGGGVLVNQAPHMLDRYIWLFGLPCKISAICETKLHKISVEDSATIITHHENGMTGQIHINTNESPTMSRIEIACDRGRINVTDGKITLIHLEESLAKTIFQADQSRSEIESSLEDIGGELMNWSPDLLHQFYENFAEAIWNNRTPEVPAAQGRDVVEIINGAHLSSWKKQLIELPIDRDEYLQFQKVMIQQEQKV